MSPVATENNAFALYCTDVGYRSFPPESVRKDTHFRAYFTVVVPSQSNCEWLLYDADFAEGDWLNHDKSAAEEPIKRSWDVETVAPKKSCPSKSS
jgi:hypothetical protein